MMDKNKLESNDNLIILIVDDDEAVRDSLTEYLQSAGWTTASAESGNKALEIVGSGKGSIVITDVCMPGMDGISLTRKLRLIDPDIEVLIATGHSNEDLAIEALKAGAFDYFRKPIKAQDVEASLQRTKKYREIRLENTRLKAVVERLTKVDNKHSFVGKSNPAKFIIQQTEKVASSSPETLILLTGQSGAGKEVIARLIHKLSQSPSSPFIPVNCGGFVETLLEAELFGHEKGAFTGADKIVPGVFEIAADGTILLDEISEMSMQAQSRFLRVLEDRCFRRLGGTKEISMQNSRIIAATNMNLEKLVEDGKFRQDLYFRIMVAPIHIPPLRERPADILPLAHHFLSKIKKIRGKKFRLSKNAECALLNYNFPGNARELRNMIERATIFSNSNEIQPSDLGIGPDFKTSSYASLGEKGIHPDEQSSLNLADYEKNLISKVLLLYPKNHSAAARVLGITSQTLYRKMNKYNLEP